MQLETHEEWLARMKSIGVSLQGYKPKVGVYDGKKRTVEKDPAGTVIHDEHPDGRVDATVRPQPVRFNTHLHGTGKKKGEVAEITRKAP